MTADLRNADAILRPTAATLAAAWAATVRAERLQVEALPDRPRPEDFYGPVAESFRGEPERPDDTVLAALLALASPSDTWLDLHVRIRHLHLGHRHRGHAVLALCGQNSRERRLLLHR